MRKDRWTESEVLSLPSGENDRFDRKSGVLLNDPDLLKKLAKSLSAFANSGGGHLVIGIRDDCTIDGVRPIHKGRTSTKDWLEQTIPELVSYPLQDFGVHEVEADTPSVIPIDSVVIVIDVGDSMLAPHQDTFTKIYYHRSGGHSVPAPHHYLDMLRGRERYPSHKIAHAWLNFVVAPWHGRLKGEREHLASGKLGWELHKRTLTSLEYINHSLTSISANEIQFLDSYSAIRDAIEKHDDGVTHTRNEVGKLFDLIADSSILTDRYEKSVSHDSIRKFRHTYGSRLGSVGATDAEMLSGLFGSMSKSERLALLAQHIVNAEGDQNETRMVWPLWNAWKNEFMEVLNFTPIREQNERANEARDQLLHCVEALISLLEQTRHELAFKHGEPYEDPTLHRES